MGGGGQVAESPPAKKYKMATRTRTIKDMWVQDKNQNKENVKIADNVNIVQPTQEDSSALKKAVSIASKDSVINLTTPEEADQRPAEMTGTENTLSDQGVTDHSENDTSDQVKAASSVVIAPDQEEESIPSPRWGHTMCMIHDGCAVVIGGQGDKQQLCKDPLWLLHLDKRKWSPTEATSSGPKPEIRMGHTAVFDPTVRSIYVYGGSKNLRWFNDVQVLDLDEWKWQLVKANGKAPTRAYHSSTVYRHEMWIFGGVYPRPDPQPDGCSNDMHIFSPIEESWYAPIVTGEKPVPRSGHSATLIGDQLVVFGGWDAPICYNDLHILDMTFVEWRQPAVNGTPPAPRSWHASSAIAGNRVLIHGGYDGNLALEDSHIFSLDTLTWTRISLEPSIPARAGHTALCLPYRNENKKHDEIWIFGGGDNDGAFFQDLCDMLVPFTEDTTVDSS